MGLGALTRKGWEQDPRKQGKSNLYAAIFGIIVGIPIIFLIDKDVDLSVLLIIPVYLGWGVFSYFMGIFLDKQRKKSKEHEQGTS